MKKGTLFIVLIALALCLSTASSALAAITDQPPTEATLNGSITTFATSAAVVTITWNATPVWVGTSIHSPGKPFGKLPELPANRPGYTFTGWWTTQTGTGTQILPTSVVPSVNTTYYARWAVVTTPRVTTDLPTISPTSIRLNGRITDNGNSPITDHGFFLSTSQSNLVNNNNRRSLGAKNGTGTFSESVTNLNPNTTYYYLAYATNIASTGYGAILSFRTPALAPTIITTGLPGGTIGKAYNQTLSANGTAPIIWSISGSLPTGLILNPSTGLISGTPTKAGTFNFTVRATNSAGFATKPLSIDISVALVPPIITTTELPAGTATVAYSQKLNASGTTPITWSIFSGSLPPGLTINSGTGVISGKPAVPGSDFVEMKFYFTTRATNSAGNDTKNLNIRYGVITLTVIRNLPEGIVGQPYSHVLKPSVYMVQPITWSLSASLPPGLKFNSKTGEIYGTPTKDGTFNSFTATAVAKDCEGKTAPMAIRVRAANSKELTAYTQSEDDNALQFEDNSIAMNEASEKITNEGNGCNAGYVSLALLGAALFVLRKRH